MFLGVKFREVLTPTGVHACELSAAALERWLWVLAGGRSEGGQAWSWGEAGRKPLLKPRTDWIQEGGQGL